METIARMIKAGVIIGLVVSAVGGLLLGLGHFAQWGPFVPAPEPEPTSAPLPTSTLAPTQIPTPLSTPTPDPHILRVIPPDEVEKHQIRLPDPLWGRADIGTCTHLPDHLG
jgi:hypothetical protein